MRKLGKYFVPHPQYPASQAYSDHVLAYLGVTSPKLPKEGLPEMIIPAMKRDLKTGNLTHFSVWAWVEPFKSNGRRKQSVHRAMCRCPDCGVTVSIGRLHQHSQIHE